MISLTLLEQATALGPQLRAMKDDLHRHPELSFQEVRTTGILKEKLTALGLELIDLGMDTGVVALLRGPAPVRRWPSGPTLTPSPSRRPSTTEPCPSATG